MSPARLVRLTGLVEGLSWLVLLFVAMPLKYGLGQPMAVRVVGMAHGVLFVSFVLVLLRAHLELEWSMSRSATLFLASLVPFGFFFVDKTLREAEAEPEPEG